MRSFSFRRISQEEHECLLSEFPQTQNASNGRQFQPFEKNSKQKIKKTTTKFLQILHRSALFTLSLVCLRVALRKYRHTSSNTNKNMFWLERCSHMSMCDSETREVAPQLRKRYNYFTKKWLHKKALYSWKMGRWMRVWIHDYKRFSMARKEAPVLEIYNIKRFKIQKWAFGLHFLAVYISQIKPVSESVQNLRQMGAYLTIETILLDDTQR